MGVAHVRARGLLVAAYESAAEAVMASGAEWDLRGDAWCRIAVKSFNVATDAIRALDPLPE